MICLCPYFGFNDVLAQLTVVYNEHGGVGVTECVLRLHSQMDQDQTD